MAKLMTVHPKFVFPSVLSESAARTTDVLDALARLLAFPALTYDVAVKFQSILVDLCARWMNMPDLEEHRVFEAFGVLLQNHRDIFPYVASSLPPFEPN
jgi:hypothetical protein